MAGAPSSPAQTTPALFEFRSAFWVNLFHYLHALGRHESPLRETLPAAATDEERAIWQRAVADYATRYGASELRFDEPLIALKTQLIAAPSAESLRGSRVGPADATLLEAAGPIYRRHLWLAHDQANLRFVALVQPLLARYGACVARLVARSFDAEWPHDGFRTDVVRAIQPGAAAYTTGTPGRITVGVSHPRNVGLSTLDMLFREGSRQWEPLLRDELQAASKKLGIEVPADLPEAVLAYNAGELTRRVLADAGVQGYELDMDAQGQFRNVSPALAVHWRAFLDGRMSRRDALRRILREVAAR